MAKQTDYQGPLAGLNVLDFGHYYAGPLVGMLLADQGANVIRIVKPGGPTSRERELPEQQYRLFNRNKRAIILDLKTEEGREQALSLIERADVLIENFRPGVMRRLGLDYADVKGKNPGLVYLSLPGFASTDKERSQIQAWEGILGAACGLFTETSTIRQTLKFPPVYSWTPHCSIYGGINGALAVMAALIARESSGSGTVIEAPLVNCGLSGFVGNISMDILLGQPRALLDSDAPLPDGLKPLAYVPGDSREVQEEKLEKARQMMMSLSSMRPFKCADGRNILVSFYFTHHIAARFVKALGIDRQLMREGFVNVSPWETGLDNNIGNLGAMSAARKERLKQLMEETYLTKTSEEWQAILRRAGVPVAVFRTREEWLALRPMLESGVLTEMDNGASKLTVPGRLVDVNGPGGELLDIRPNEMEFITVAQASDLLAKHRTKSTSSGTYQPQRKGDLLKGLKILDLANVIAGPTSSLALAHYGAEVIKADAPNDSYNPVLMTSTLEINQGKRSILTDVKTAPGREIFERLVSWADVVIHNSLDDTAGRLGVTQEQLQAINPNIICCQMSAYGGTYRGGWEMQAGFDNLLQAATGLMIQFGTKEQPHMHGWVSGGDVPGGYSMALAALMAVYQQRKTGYSGEARTSLARAMNYIQLPYMIAEKGVSYWGEPGGQFAVGESEYQRIYQCQDGWIYVAASEDKAEVFSTIVAERRNADEKILEACFIEYDCAHWLSQLNSAGVACHPVLSATDIYAAAEVRSVNNDTANELAEESIEVLRWNNHPCGYPFVSLAPDHVRIGENHSYWRLSTAPRLGENTCAILGELGYDEERIKHLIHLKVSHEYLPALGGVDAYLFDPSK